MEPSLASPRVLYQPKTSHDHPGELFPRVEKIDALEFLARVITQIPEPRRQLLFYYGHYANVVRGRRKMSQPEEQTSHPHGDGDPQEDGPTLSPARKQALRRRWADLIRGVFELDPLVCPCGGSFRIVAFITQPFVIRKILDHLDARSRQRAPPGSSTRLP